MAGRSLQECELKESIRYRSGDHVEVWLNSLLCLEAAAPNLGEALLLQPDTEPMQGSVDPHSFFADPDPAFLLNADADQAAILMRIRIQL